MNGKNLGELDGPTLMNLHRLGKVAERRLENDDVRGVVVIRGSDEVVRVDIRGGTDLHTGAIIMEELGATVKKCDTDSRFSAKLRYELTDDSDS